VVDHADVPVAFEDPHFGPRHPLRHESRFRDRGHQVILVRGEKQRGNLDPVELVPDVVFPEQLEPSNVSPPADGPGRPTTPAARGRPDSGESGMSFPEVSQQLEIIRRVVRDESNIPSRGSVCKVVRKIREFQPNGVLIDSRPLLRGLIRNA